MHMSEWTVEVIRAAYFLDSNQREWLTRVARILAKSIAGAESWLACGFQVCPCGVQPTVFAASEPPLAMVNPLLDIYRNVPPALRAVFAEREAGVGSVRSWKLADVAGFQQYLQSSAMDDCFFVFVVCDDGTGCAFFFPCDYRPRASQSRRWRRVLPHLAAGWQFRRADAYFARVRGAPDKETRSGESTDVEHAPELTDTTAQDDKLDTVMSPAGGPSQALDSARTWDELAIAADAHFGRPSDRAPIEQLWRQVFKGEWSRFAHFASAGRRYLVFRRMSPELGGPLSLTSRERRIVELATRVEYPDLRGIAREMGCKESTAATHLARAMKKLGVRSRAELIALLVAGQDGRRPSRSDNSDTKI